MNYLYETEGSLNRVLMWLLGLSYSICYFKKTHTEVDENALSLLWVDNWQLFFEFEVNSGYYLPSRENRPITSVVAHVTLWRKWYTINSWHYSCPRSVYCLSIVFLKYIDSVMKIFTHIPYNRWDKYRKRKVPCTLSVQFTQLWFKHSQFRE